MNEHNGTNGHNLAPIEFDVIRNAKEHLITCGPMREAARGGYITACNLMWFSWCVIDALSSSGVVSIEGEAPQRIVRLAS